MANFSAHKHVRSEKDRYSIQALIENNDIKAKKLMDMLTVYPPKHFFCVSTDKAANPVNIMGASKRIMEDLVMAYNKYFKVTTARFANVRLATVHCLTDGFTAYRKNSRWQHLLTRSAISFLLRSLAKSVCWHVFWVMVGKCSSRSWVKTRCIHSLQSATSSSRQMV